MARRQWSEQVVVRAALLAAALTTGAVSPRAGSAQERATLSVAAGMAAGRGTGPGAIAMVGYTRPLPISRLAVRFDLSYSQWGRIAEGRVTMGTANLTYRVPMGPLSGYALAGVGGYAHQGHDISFGWNGGLGLRLDQWRVKPFLEARYHRVPSSREVMPLTIGVSF